MKTPAETPARKPPGAKGRARAEAILTAAHALLIDEGYASLTARKVAQRAGVRLSHVQYYFGNKAELVRALFAHAIAGSTRELARRMAERPRPPRRRFLLAVDHFLASHHAIAEQRLLRELWALSAHDPDVAAVMNGFYRRYTDLTAASLLAINPRLGRRRAQRRALLVISLIDGLSLFHGAVGLDHPAVEGIEREARALVLTLAGSAERAGRGA